MYINDVKKGYLYFVRVYDYTNNEEFIKVGITTTNIALRVEQAFTKAQFDTNIELRIYDDYDKLLKLQSKLLNRYKKFTPTAKFKGMTTCITVDSLPDIIAEFVIDIV